MEPRNQLKKIITLILLFQLVSFFGFNPARAADGSGANSVSPVSVTSGSTGNTLTFTFTAAETMDSGGIAITVPAGWSAPQGTSGVSGYTTASSTSGMIATVKDNADSVSGWSAGNACNNGISSDSATKHEGAASIKCANGNQGNNNRWYKNISSENWSGYTRVAFWIYSSGTINNTNLRFAYDNNPNIGSPLEQISFGQNIPANTWTYIVLNFGSTNRASIRSFGFIIRSGSDLDNKNVWIDDILIGPGSPTFPGGGVISARFLQLGPGQTATIIYGNGGGASGATAPSSCGVSAFTTQSRASDSGTLTNISSSPTVSVIGLISKFSLNSPGPITAGTRAAYTVTRKDDCDNLMTSGTTTVYLYSDSTSSNKAFYNVAAGGSPITSIAITNGNSSADFWYYDDTAGTWTITASDNAAAPDGAAGIDDATDSLVVTAAPIAATKFVILNPTDGNVGDNITITVRAEDNSGNLDTSYQNDVTLVASGSATGAGLVDIINGVGTRVITDAVAETVNLSLSDTEGTGLDVSSTQDVVFTAAAVTPTPTEGPVPIVRDLKFSGRAFPGASVKITNQSVLKEFSLEEQTVTSSDGRFSVGYFGTVPTSYSGPQTFGLTVTDQDGRISSSSVYNLDVKGSLYVSGVVFPPTVGLANMTISEGSPLVVEGYASPFSKINIAIDGNVRPEETSADEEGLYKFSVDTKGFSLGSHAVKTQQTDTNGQTSNFSVQRVFIISSLTGGGIKSDFNNDGKIDINDWSVFLSEWGQLSSETRNKIDLNGDGKIDISDFSIFIKALKK